VIQLLIILICLHSPYAIAYMDNAEGNAEAELITELLQDYPSMTAPIPTDSDGCTTVELYLAFLSVTITTVVEQATIQLWWRMYWNDPRLAWNETHWNLTSVLLVADSVWVPDIGIYEQVASQKERKRVTVTSSGNAFISIPMSTTIPCSMTITSFPYDDQKFTFTVGEVHVFL
jgi:hypothetical protein